MHAVLRRMSLLSCLALPVLAFAADPGHPCASVADPAARLACYDEAFPPAPEVREAAVDQAREDFGLKREAPALANPGQPASELDPDRIESRVSKVVYHNGGRTISLENGQSWRLTEATSRGHVNEGEVVVVRKGLMGNFMLVTAAGAGLRVRRVR